MILNICSVFDKAAQAYGRPIFVPAVGSASRSFSDEVNRVDPSNEMNRHPQDFSLFILGQFDDSTGVITPQVPSLVVDGLSVFNS